MTPDSTSFQFSRRTISLLWSSVIGVTLWRFEISDNALPVYCCLSFVDPLGLITSDSTENIAQLPPGGAPQIPGYIQPKLVATGKISYLNYGPNTETIPEREDAARTYLENYENVALGVIIKIGNDPVSHITDVYALINNVPTFFQLLTAHNYLETSKTDQETINPIYAQIGKNNTTPVGSNAKNAGLTTDVPLLIAVGSFWIVDFEDAPPIPPLPHITELGG